MSKTLILVVEDDTPVHNLITTTLKTHDYKQPHWGQTPLLFRNFVPVLAILTLQTVLNDNIKTAEDVETYLGLNTLVVVPDFGSKKKSRRRRKD